MAATERFAFTPVTSIPVALGTNYVFLRLGTTVELYLKTTGTAGNVTMLVWIPEASAGSGAWYPYQNPLPVDPSVNGGKAHGRWVVDKDAYRYWQLLLPAGMTATEAFVQGIEV